MKSELVLILREILSQMETSKSAPPDGAAVRSRLREKGVSEPLIADALFLLDVIGDIATGKKDRARPTRILSAEELQGLNAAVVGKLFRLYYLGYMKKEEMEQVMTNLLFAPPEVQDRRARESVAAVLGITPAQAEFLFDGGVDSAVVH